MIFEALRQFDESKKTREWMQRILVELNMRKQWLISKGRYDENQSYANGTYSVDSIMRQYDTVNQPASTLNIDFSPLDLLGNRINSIVSMIEKMGFSPKAKTTDPTARDKKDTDIELLKAEKELEPLRKKMANALGMKNPLPIASEEDFSSDMTPIKSMNLDINNPIDEAIFRDYLQKQVWEIALEIGMEHYLKKEESTEKEKLWLADLINHNCAAAQVVTNSYSGEPMLSYLYPFNAFTVLSKQNDGKDAIAKGWEKDVTVREVIALMGTQITSEELLQVLAQANTNGSTNYQGIWMGGTRADYTDGFAYPYGTERDQCCTWEQFINLTCSLGYIELKSQNSDLYVHRKENGNLYTEKQPYDYVLPTSFDRVKEAVDLSKPNDRFLEYKFYDVTYCSFYLPFSNIVFGFGKLPLAVRYGTANELTDFSIVTQRLKGKSMTQKCIPFVKHIMSMWAKIQYFINESRPSGESWDIDVVRELSQEIIGTSANESKIIETLKALQNQTNTVHKSVKMINDQPIGGDGDPVKQRIRGLDPTIIQMYDLIQRDKNQIIEITGVSDVLLATQSSQAGLGVSQLILQQSINTIYYIQSAVQKLFGDICLNFGHKIQTIVTGDKSTEAYKSIEKAIGQRNVEALKLMGKTPTWGYSIFIEWGMNQLERQQVDQLTDLLIQSKSITAAQAFQIKDVNNWKLSAALLSYYEQKNLQLQQAAQMASANAAAALEAQKNQGKLAEIDREGQWKDKVANTQGSWTYRTEELQLKGKSEIEDKRQVSKMIQSSDSHDREIEKITIQQNGQTP